MAIIDLSTYSTPTGSGEFVEYYRMPRQERDVLTDSSLDHLPYAVPYDERFIGVEIDPEQATGKLKSLANVARGLEGTIFETTFKDTPESTADLLARVELDSSFLLVIDLMRPGWRGKLKARGPSVVGGMRVVRGQTASELTIARAVKELNGQTIESSGTILRTGSDVLENLGMTPKDVKDGALCDIATLVIEKKYRATQLLGHACVSGLLQRIFYEASVRDNVRKAVTLIDHAALGALKSVGTPFEYLCGIQKDFSVAGSQNSSAQYFDVDQLYDKRSIRYEVVKGYNDLSLPQHIARRGLRRAMLADGRRLEVIGMGLGHGNVDASIILSRPLQITGSVAT